MMEIGVVTRNGGVAENGEELDTSEKIMQFCLRPSGAEFWMPLRTGLGQPEVFQNCLVKPRSALGPQKCSQGQDKTRQDKILHTQALSETDSGKQPRTLTGQERIVEGSKLSECGTGECHQR